MMNERRITLEQLEQTKPYKPTCDASDFAADKLHVLQALEEAGTAGLTTRELMDRGGGMRPPNRIHDLREDGIAIKTISEGRGVYRYVLCKFLPEEKVASPAAPPSPRKPESVKPKVAWADRQRVTGLPLFDSAVRG